MKRAFWGWVFLAVALPLAGVTLAGGYFSQEQKIKEQREILKAGLKKDSLKLQKELNQLILTLSKELENIATEKLFPKDSLFSAVILKARPPSADYAVFIPQHDTIASSNPSPAFFQALAARLPEKLKGVRFHDVSAPNEKEKFLAFIIFSPDQLFSWEERAVAMAAGFIRHEKLRQIFPTFLNFSDRETREAFLLTGQGWLLFHTGTQNVLNPLSEKVLPKRALRTQTSRFVRWGKGKAINLAYILPDDKSHLFIATKALFKPAPFVLSSLNKSWLLICLGALVFILSALSFIISPLFSAFFELKNAFFQYSQNRDLPFIVPSSPFLSFYPNIRKQIRDRERPIASEQPLKRFKNKEQGLSFKQVLQEECTKLKRKYPGVSLQQDLKANVFLWQFEPFMKKIISALLLNAIEAMGGQVEQTVTVRTLQQPGRFIFTIEDRGPGLTGEQSHRAFSLYYSTKSQLGAGLNLVTSLVTANKGSVKLLPRSGGGTVASVSLPDSCFLKTQSFKPKSIFSLVKDKSKDFKGRPTVSFVVSENTKRSRGSGIIH